MSGKKRLKMFVNSIFDDQGNFRDNEKANFFKKEYPLLCQTAKEFGLTEKQVFFMDCMDENLEFVNCNEQS